MTATCASTDRRRRIPLPPGPATANTRPAWRWTSAMPVEPAPCKPASQIPRQGSGRLSTAGSTDSSSDIRPGPRPLPATPTSHGICAMWDGPSPRTCTEPGLPPLRSTSVWKRPRIISNNGFSFPSRPFGRQGLPAHAGPPGDGVRVGRNQRSGSPKDLLRLPLRAP